MHYVTWLGLWLKVKCLHRENSCWSPGPIPKARSRGSLRCCSPITVLTGGLVYAGRVGTGIKRTELERLWQPLQPLAISKMPLEVQPPRTSRFGSPLVLSRVHWVKPEFVAEVKYLTWTDDNLLRQVVYQGLR
jgi:ATP-dependent DNA ligase